MTDKMEPITPNFKTPPPEAITDKPVPVPPMVNNEPSTGDKLAANKWWIGLKHFIYGFSIGATASLVAGAHPYLAVGLGVAGGIAEATRKITKEKVADKGSDWADILDKLLKIIVAIVDAMKKKKEVQK